MKMKTKPRSDYTFYPTKSTEEDGEKYAPRAGLGLGMKFVRELNGGIYERVSCGECIASGYQDWEDPRRHLQVGMVIAITMVARGY